jgi:hypothetical protein
MRREDAKPNGKKQTDQSHTPHTRLHLNHPANAAESIAKAFALPPFLSFSI